MASVENCVYQSITLNPGEPFNLPPGAEIISATDINSLSSTCPLPTNLETPACYSIQIQESISDGGDAAYNDVIVTGVVINNVVYAFSSNINPPNNVGTPTSFINDLTTRLNELGLGSLFSDWSGYQDDIPNTGDAAMITMLCFKTIPSIGDNMFFTAYGDQDGSAPNVPINIPVLTSAVMLSQYLGGGSYDQFVNACGCR
jgi:hypothetical protein